MTQDAGSSTVERSDQGPQARWSPGALGALSLAMLMPSLDTSTVNAGLPSLARAFHAPLPAVQWVVLAYLVAITSLIVSAGRLGDIVGRKRLMLAGIGVFTISSLLSGVAQTLSLLVAARAAQGVGAAIMMALAMALVADTMPRAGIGRAMGLLGTMSAVGTTLGPSAGGLLIAVGGWRSMFLANVPLGVAAFVFALRSLPADRPSAAATRTAEGLDGVGTLLLALTLAAYALAMTIGRGHFGRANLGLLGTALLGLLLFGYSQTRVSSPLIRLSMLRGPALARGLAMSALVATVMMATLVVGPFYLSRALGLGVAHVGLVMSAGPLVAGLTGMPAGRIVDRIGSHLATAVALAGLTAGLLALALAPAAFGVAGYLAAMVLVAATYALFQAANNASVMADVLPDHRGVTASMLGLSRNLGLITGASVMGAVFVHASETSELADASSLAVAAGMRITYLVAALLGSTALAIALHRGRRRSGERSLPVCAPLPPHPHLKGSPHRVRNRILNRILMKRSLTSLLVLVLCAAPAVAQQPRVFQVKSPDGQLSVTLRAGTDLTWSVDHGGTSVVAPSVIALTLQSGEVLGRNPRVSGSRPASVNATITPVAYKKKTIADRYNQVTVTLRDGYSVVLRAYDDGGAYRLVLDRPGDVVVQNETVNFNFAGDYTAHVPYIRDLRDRDPFISAQEAHYDVQKLSAVKADSMAYSPLLVELDGGKKAVVLEADLEAYPGMFVKVNSATRRGFQGVFAPFPKREQEGGHATLNLVLPERESFVARISGRRSLPWRGVAVSARDADLINNDLVYKLAAPSRVGDVSWIKPGKAAWEWWNDWNLRGVDFATGVNMPTYRYFIDFAAANKLEYVVVDAGWSTPRDLTKARPEIQMEELISYAKSKGVDLFLWGSWRDLRGKEDIVFPLYAKMGIKGFKIDFIDRDDQKAVESVYHMAERAAANKLLLDLHGMYKPTGFQRTYPNLVNFEGVKGLENVKWTPVDDVPRYDVTAPYIRMLVGPMDYTPGAMRNANRGDFRANNSAPMSHGTRTHQLAMYTIFDAPIQMLADSPTNYQAEQESTDFIAKVPTVFDETVALDGKVGEYVAVARRKGDTWYVGAMTNWTPRDLTIDLSFLGTGSYQADIFQDGVNARKDARDYKRVTRRVTGSEKLSVKLGAGGGWTARFEPVR